ncbi:hypothetical protein [Nocardia salmonicida]|uniref:hypothetical protein n=1 Tax=Nocardia salmonicida TaxID=53431 RepID=UPI0037ACBAAA
MAAITVGQPYDSRRSHWTPVPIARITETGIRLVLVIENPTETEVAAVRSGVARFAWIDASDIALLAWTFAPGIPWSDVPYSPHLERPGDTPGICFAPQRPAAVTVVLVDADTGLVCAVRETTWPHEFAAVVRDSVAEMAAIPADMNAIDAAMASLYITYPDTAELVAMRAAATCTGGQLTA